MLIFQFSLERVIPIVLSSLVKNLFGLFANSLHFAINWNVFIKLKKILPHPLLLHLFMRFFIQSFINLEELERLHDYLLKLLTKIKQYNIYQAILSLKFVETILRSDYIAFVQSFLYNYDLIFNIGGAFKSDYLLHALFHFLLLIVFKAFDES